MTIKIAMAETDRELKPRITVIGVGGAGGNAVNNMIRSNLCGVDFMVANTDAQALNFSQADQRIQLGLNLTRGLGAGSRPEIGRGAAEEALDQIMDRLAGSHMVFITAGMGGGTGTGAGPVIARAAREAGLLTVGVVTKPFHFEGTHRMRMAEAGIEELTKFVDTLIIIPNQNLFRIANEKTTFADAFKMADDVLYSGVRGVTDLMIMPGLINLDFADIRAVMSEMGKAMMGTGEAEGAKRAVDAAEAAISNPLLDDMSMKGARGMLINITGGLDMTLFEVDEAANRIRDEVDPNANIIFGATFDEAMEGRMRVSVVATGIDAQIQTGARPFEFKPTLVPTGPRADAPDAAALAASNGVPPIRFPEPFDNGHAPQVQPAAAFFGQPAAPQPASPFAAPASFQAAAFQAGAQPGMALPMQPAAEASAGFVEARTMPMTHGNAAVATEPAFVPPAPMVPRERPILATPEPAAAAPAPQAPQPEPKRSRFGGIFGAVTGAGRRREAEPSEEVHAEPEAPAQQRLGGMNPSDRLPVSRQEEDLLDIPAFLRRQAN